MPYRLLFILMCLFLSSMILQAQTDFRPGYIITNQGDTVYGDIDYRGDILMSTLCKFKTGDNDIREYTPREISAFRFKDSKFFVSREIDKQMFFLEYLIKGKVNIYYLRYENTDHYYLDKEGEELAEIPYEEGIISKDGKNYAYKSKKHIGVLSLYMQDAPPEFQSRISKIETPDNQNLVKLAEDYHQAVCKDEDCVIYEKKQAFLKVNIEVVGGIQNFANNDELVDKTFFQTGLLFHFWMPGLNEKVYLKTGLLYTPVEDIDGDKYAHFRIPFHIGYIAPSTYLIRPFASIGLLSPSYSGGVLVRINKHVNVGVQSWVNCSFNTVPWIPYKLKDYSIFGSVLIML